MRIRKRRGAAVTAVTAITTQAQTNYEPYAFSTLAGLAASVFGSQAGGYIDAKGSAARFSAPVGAAVDTAGNVYVADYDNYAIRKVTPEGVVTTLAGSGRRGYA